MKHILFSNQFFYKGVFESTKQYWLKLTTFLHVFCIVNVNVFVVKKKKIWIFPFLFVFTCIMEKKYSINIYIGFPV